MAGAALAPAFRARVVATYGRTALVELPDGGTLSASRRSRRADLVVGDLVQARATSSEQAVVESIDARTSLLYRTDAHRIKELAANVDQVMVLFAARPPFDREFLWKALVAAHCAGIEAIVVRTKCDLPDGELAQATLDQLAALGWRTLAVSCAPEAPVPPGLEAALAQRATLLIGQSGMGKSTLVNRVVPGADVRTQDYSRHLNMGKQTTTAARWFALPGGGAIVDTPGFREFGLAHLGGAQIADSFPELRRALGEATCRFLDCRHLEEPDCAVRAAVDAGAMAPERYRFYRDLALAGSR